MPHSEICPFGVQQRRTASPAAFACRGVLMVIVFYYLAFPAATVAAQLSYEYRDTDRSVVVKDNGAEHFTIHGLGPVTIDGRYVDAEIRTAFSEVDGIFRIDFRSSATDCESVFPGTIDAGRWVGLDLNQYGLAHGQPFAPKTYWLPDCRLFLCVWWDRAESNGSKHFWDDALCDPRQGEGEFAPAATVVYQNNASLRETLCLRAGERLWDVVLPSLCEPSEYREELATMVFIDDWSSQSMSETANMLRVFERLAGKYVRFLTVVQDWEAGGFDVLLPDSLRMPEFPPSPAMGTIEEFRKAVSIGKSLGRFTFRTNYMFLQRESPTFLNGEAGFLLEPDGKESWVVQPSRWKATARRQEEEIRTHFAPNAAFTDQLASGGLSSTYIDFNREAGGDGTLRTSIARQRELARFLKTFNEGPLGSETLNQQDLIGKYCDYGDFGINDGHGRLYPFDYKLRRLHELTMFYGCGLCYRFFELPPYNRYHSGKNDPWSDRELIDDYRCTAVLFGNGAYVYLPSFWEYRTAKTWEYRITEAILLGRLQRRYALAPVAEIYYESHGVWRTLEDMVRDGLVVQRRPWNEKQVEFGRVRIDYANGLCVVGNRLPEPLDIEIADRIWTLPQYGWVAFEENSGFFACSAIHPEWKKRVDYLDEGTRGPLRFLNPRGEEIEGEKTLRLWKNDEIVWSVDPVAETARDDSGDFPLSFPIATRQPDFDFTHGLDGWRPVAGILRTEVGNNGTELTIAGGCPQLYSPPLDWTGGAHDVLEVTLSCNSGSFGHVFFTTEKHCIISGERSFRFPLVPDGKMRTVCVDLAHAEWNGSQIRRIRFDPSRGGPGSVVTLRDFRIVAQNDGVRNNSAVTSVAPGSNLYVEKAVTP